MSKTNYLQAVISDLQRTAGPYRCANRSNSSAEKDTAIRSPHQQLRAVTAAQ